MTSLTHPLIRLSTLEQGRRSSSTSNDTNTGYVGPSLLPPSDGQEFEKPHRYTGAGTEGKGQGMDLKTLEKPIPSSWVAGYPWYMLRVFRTLVMQKKTGTAIGKCWTTDQQ